MTAQEAESWPLRDNGTVTNEKRWNRFSGYSRRRNDHASSSRSRVIGRVFCVYFCTCAFLFRLLEVWSCPPQLSRSVVPKAAQTTLSHVFIAAPIHLTCLDAFVLVDLAGSSGFADQIGMTPVSPRTISQVWSD